MEGITLPPATNNLAPTTNLQTAYDEEAAVYQPQVNQVGVQLQAIPGQQADALSSLDQAKANAFKDNSLNANARGVLFGGVAPQANEDYTTNTYNPAVKNTNATFSARSQSLQDKITSINQERANAAQSLVAGTQNAQDVAARSAASAAKTAAKAAVPTTNQIANSIRTNLVQVTGKDGYVSPEDYAQAYIDWINNGQSSSSFNSTFGNLKNPKNGYYNYAITEAVKRGS